MNLARRKQEAKNVTNQFMELAAQVYRAGLTATLKAEPEEDFHDALVRVIDARIAYNRWYRRLWRAVAR